VSVDDDVRAITALLHDYTYLLDAGDIDGVVALFAHAELRSTGHERVRRGTEEAREIYQDLIIYEDGTPRTMHQLTNVTVTVVGDRATARSYFTVLAVTAQGLHPILAGEYRDRFRRAPGGWEYAERIFDPKLFGDMSGHMAR
jgi:ketosteroid isomerase-like protein